MSIAKVDFLWFKAGDEVPDNEVQSNWVDDGLVESGKAKKVIGKKKPSKKGADFYSTSNFKTELVSFKGIGLSTAEDIVAVYPTEASLIKGVKSDHLPFTENIVKILKKKFKK